MEFQSTLDRGLKLNSNTFKDIQHMIFRTKAIFQHFREL